MNEKTSKSSMDFETAKESMDPLQVTDCLNKTLDFLRRNTNELRFPNISTNIEAFLVNLVSDTRNLKSRSFTDEDRSLALEIIEILEMSREVFRFTYSYENGKVNSKVLTYKKIYTNKMKEKQPTKTSSVAHRLIQSLNSTEPQSTQDSTISASFQLNFLNRTLSFIKNDSERTLYYSEMPIPQAEYIQSVVQTNGDNHVGFGFKALYAPLWEAMDQLGEVFRLKITLSTQRQGYATLKLEKILKTDTSVENRVAQFKAIEPDNDTRKEPEPKSTGAIKKKMKAKLEKIVSSPSTPLPFSDQQLLSNLSHSFMRSTIRALTRLAGEGGGDSMTFAGLSAHQMCAVRKVKAWAASPNQRNKFAPELRELLLELHSVVSQNQRKYMITTTIREKEGAITLKKSPLFYTPPPPVVATPVPLVARSKSLTAPSLTIRATSKGRTVQFQTTGSEPKPEPTTTTKEPRITVKEPESTITTKEPEARTTTKEPEPGTTTKEPGTTTKEPGTTTKEPEARSTTKEPEPRPIAKERGRSGGRVLTNPKAKLLEDLSTPIESDKGMRMMLLMGWDGGALGARGDGITEPIMPNINKASKAGFGCPSKPEVPSRPSGLPAPPAAAPGPARRPAAGARPEDPSRTQSRIPRDFREAFFQKLAELVLGDDARKVMQYHNPVPKSDRRFIPQSLQLLNARRAPGLELSPPGAGAAVRVLQKLVEHPRVAVASEWSQDFRTLTIRKFNKVDLTDPNSNVKSTEPFDVLLTKQDIKDTMSRLDVLPCCHIPKRLRALRMLMLTTMERALRSDAEEMRITFSVSLKTPLIAFIKDTVNSLKTDDCQRYVTALLEGERGAYARLRGTKGGDTVAVQFYTHQQGYFVLRKTKTYPPITNNTPKGNNNDDKMDNQNDRHTDENTIATGNDENLKKTTSNIETSDGSNKLIAALEKHISNNDNNVNKDDIESSDNNAVNKNEMRNNDNSIITKHGMDVENKIGTDKVVIKEEIVESKEETDFDCDYESDFDKEIKDLEMAICKAEVEYNVKKNTQSDLGMEIDIAQIKKEVDDPNDLAMRIDDLNITKPDDTPGHKRSSTNISSLDELDPKRTKLAIGNVVIISPNDAVAYNLDTNFLRHVQLLIVDGIDKTGESPLLKCYGIQKRGLVYSGHSKEDTDWLKNVISKVKYLNYKIDDDESCIAKEKIIVAIKINTAVDLCTNDIFRRFEIFNPGLNTASWKVLASRGIKNIFYLIVAEIDDVSLKWISDEKFSLYCGIDCAHFTVLY